MTAKTKTRCFVGAALAMAIAFALVSFSWYHALAVRGPRINKGTYERITEGMTISQVRELFGVAEGDYGPGEVGPLPSNGLGLFDNRVWRMDDVHVTVTFDSRGTVIGKELLDYYPVDHNRSWLNSIRRWFL